MHLGFVYNKRGGGNLRSKLNLDSSLAKSTAIVFSFVGEERHRLSVNEIGHWRACVDSLKSRMHVLHWVMLTTGVNEIGIVESKMHASAALVNIALTGTDAPLCEHGLYFSAEVPYRRKGCIRSAEPKAEGGAC